VAKNEACRAAVVGSKTSSEQIMTRPFCIAILVGFWIFSQQSTLPQTKILRISSSKKLNVPLFSTWDRVESDSHGDLYFRPVASNNNYGTSEIIKLNISSEAPTVYQIPSELGEASALVSFSVTASGNVWFLNEMKKTGSFVVLGFDSSGQMTSQTNLDVPKRLMANRFLVAEDGIILVGGFFGQDAAKELQGKGYLSVFDKAGTVRKDLGKDWLKDVGLTTVSTKMIENGATTGQDGNFYFLEGNDIIVISEWGEVVRHIKIQRPPKASDALGMDFSEGLLSIQFYEKDADGLLRSTFVVIESSTGEPYGVYTPSEELGEAVVGFSRRNGYLFSHPTPDGKILLLYAQLR